MKASVVVLSAGLVLAVATWSEGAPAPAWRYTAIKDTMRGTTGREACVSALMTVRLAFPYRSQRPELCVRTHPGASEVYVDLPHGGQFTTHDFTHLRLDDGPIEIFYNATDDTNDTLFLEEQELQPPREVLTAENPDRSIDFGALFKWKADQPSLAQQIKGARMVIVEVELYGAGTQEVRFAVGGLKWDAR